MKSIVVTDKNIKKFVDGSGVAVLDFWAPWCGPCKVMGPTIDALATNNGGSRIGKLNVDESGVSAAAYGIRTIPTLIFFKDGVESTRLSGVNVLSKLQEIIDELV
mgnify:FL=1